MTPYRVVSTDAGIRLQVLPTPRFRQWLHALRSSLPIAGGTVATAAVVAAILTMTTLAARELDGYFEGGRTGFFCKLWAGLAVIFLVPMLAGRVVASLNAEAIQWALLPSTITIRDDGFVLVDHEGKVESVGWSWLVGATEVAGGIFLQVMTHPPIKVFVRARSCEPGTVTRLRDILVARGLLPT